jgi:hypothetical protein
MFKPGDKVRIIESGKTGSICDISTYNGRTLYIIDCSEECDSNSFFDLIITVEEYEIESV